MVRAPASDRSALELEADLAKNFRAAAAARGRGRRP